MRKVVTVAAKDVRVGDELFNRHAYHPAAQWVRVTAVEPPDGLGYVGLVTSVYTEAEHGESGVTVRREVTNA